MIGGQSRREFLAGVGGIGLTGLAGCTSFPNPGAQSPDRTVYVGAYHWGFVLFDENGDSVDRVTVDQGSTVEFVGFSAGAEQAIEQLPAAIRENVPHHHELEERNVGAIPIQDEESLHEALEVAEQQYPDHSLQVVPTGSGGMHGGGGHMMGGGGLVLRHDATEPEVARLTADQRGSFSIVCGIYCGYGHPYMTRPAVIDVR